MPREDGNENDEIVDENSQEVNINVICGQTKVLQMSASSTLADAGQNVFPGQPPWIVTKFVVDEKVVDGASLVSSLGGRPLTIIREQKYCNSKKELPLRCSHANLHPQLNKVEDLAFFKSPITTVSWPGTLTHVGYSSFQATSLTHVDLPNSVVLIESWAFSEATSLRRATGEGVREIRSNGFSSCSELEQIYFPNAELLEHECFKDTKVAEVRFPHAKEIQKWALNSPCLRRVFVNVNTNVHPEAWPAGVIVEYLDE